ncbi:MAG: hypothetical protein JNJ47_04555 [Alphaproteobacteria bacterium]|nr:hypothetical protein [Alphaproteobacteria bacterium]
MRDFKGNYFHIDTQGKRLYSQNYSYVGDFKDGIAVVCDANGRSIHINEEGQYIHSNWYAQLDIFHKAFARAKDESGWFHVTREGKPAYTHRFADVEPFYNGQAHAQTHSGDLIIINEVGKMIREISSSQKNLVGSLSNDLVGFWKSKTIELAIEYGLLDILPATESKITETSKIPLKKVQRVMRALGEIEFAEKSSNIWMLTDKGHLLTPRNESFMAAACQMWSKVQNDWDHLSTKLKDAEDYHHFTFKEKTTDEKALEIYRRALEGYAQVDFSEIAKWPCWGQYSSLVGFGQTSITFLKEILKTHSQLKGILAHEDLPLYHLTIEPALQERLFQIFIDYNKNWAIEAEAAIMPRFLHYFPDKDVSQLLERTSKVLPNSGHLYVFEMILDPDGYAGGLLDLNMLAESGGGLRTYDQWNKLLEKAGFSISKYQPIKPHLHLIQGHKK